MVEGFLDPDAPRYDARALICPHAGYIYSGRVAGAVYSRARLPRRYIIMCPNHTGMGAPLSINLDGAWETPLGTVPVDTELARALAEHCPELEDDIYAHLREHALEVQLPFLQVMVEDFRFVPICIGTSRWSTLQSLADAIVTVLPGLDEPVLLIASTDMTHYEPASVAAQKDRYAMEKIEALDGRGLYDVVHERNLSMCGYLPTTVTLLAARALGAQRAERVMYTHSGEVTGDHESVVAYAGYVIT